MVVNRQSIVLEEYLGLSGINTESIPSSVANAVLYLLIMMLLIFLVPLLPSLVSPTVYGEKFARNNPLKIRSLDLLILMDHIISAQIFLCLNSTISV